MIDWKWEEDVIEFLKLRLVDLVLSNYWQALHVMQIIIAFDAFSFSNERFQFARCANRKETGW